jgi:DNA-3-methyladenine glycosylase I
MHRCPWPSDDALMIEYHDKEWGVPVHDDRKWFEFIVLDAFQAGLSWKTVLHKRENFRKAFDDFDYNRIAVYSEGKVNELLADKGIIRNRLKIRSTISNAQAFIRIQEEFSSFDKYIWSFSGNKTIDNALGSLGEMPVTSELSDIISKDLKKRGFNFVGSTIVYSFLQAAGIVNDHITSCFRYKELKGKE